MDNARAVLAPLLAEGFGLPVAEATAAQVSVIATDIAPFRERPVPGLTLIEPLDGQGWLEAIRAMAAAPRQAVVVSTSASTFTEKVERFLDE
jgi:glycosyltransferase involved in cell wall biosynthesis